MPVPDLVRHRSVARVQGLIRAGIFGIFERREIKIHAGTCASTRRRDHGSYYRPSDLCSARDARHRRRYDAPIAIPTSDVLQIDIRTPTASYTLRVDQKGERAAPDWTQTLTDLFGRLVVWKGPQAEPAPPAPVPAPVAAGEAGVAEMEAYLRASLSQPAANDAQAAELEQRRIDAVQVMAKAGRDGGSGGQRAALDALVRLLDFDTGYLPLHSAQMKQTMRVSVVTALCESGDPSAVDPLIRTMQTEQQAAQDAARASIDAPALGKEGRELLRRAQVAGELFNKAAEALGRLGDARALPALRAALEKAPVGTKRPIKQAIKTIESHQAR